jgi:hypothetical protein
MFADRIVADIESTVSLDPSTSCKAFVPRVSCLTTLLVARAGEGAVTNEDSGPPEFESPLDDLFVEGARYREPSARERASQARESERQDKQAARQERRRRQKASGRRWLPWIGLAVVVVAVWGLMSLGGGDGDDSDPAPTSTTTTTVSNPSSPTTETETPTS